MTESLIIRFATVEDAPAVHGMIVALASATGKRNGVTSTPADLAREGFGESAAFQALIALHDNEPVGLAIFFAEFSTWRGECGTYIQDLYVAPHLRGSGIGQRLIETVVAHAEQRRVRYLRLAVDKTNVAAARFYARLGFVETDDRVLLMRIGAPDRLHAVGPG